MKNRFPIKAILVATTALTATPCAFADEADDDIEDIVVTAGRRSQPISQVAKSIAVLDADDLQARQYSYVVDALQSLPGVATNQNGSFGGLATTSIRGAGTDQTVVLIDGVQVNDPSSVGGAFDFSNLDAQGIDRIEVLRGPQAVLYGSDAMGGVINIITKKGGEGFGGTVFAEYGAFDSLHTGGNIFGGSDKLGFNLTASFKDTDGISAADEADGNTETDGYKNLSLRGKLHGKLSDAVGFEITSTYSDSENEYDGFSWDGLGFSLGDSDDNSTTEEFSIAGRGFFDFFDGRLSNTLSIEYSSIERANYDGDTFSYGAEGDRFNLDYLAVAELAEGWTLTAGAQHEEVQAKSVDPRKVSTDSLFGILSFSGIEGLVLSGGIRLDDHETFGSTTNGELNASYIVSPIGTRLTAAWSEGFKASTIFQQTFACCGFEANPDIQPERAEAWEIGIQQPLMDGRLNVSFLYYEQDTDDLIDFSFTNGYDNIARARSKGVEIGFDAALTDTLSLNANYTYTDARDVLADIRLARRPKNKVYASLTWQATDKLNTNLMLLHNGNELDSSGVILEGWTRVDLRASYELNETFELYGRIDNLFDENYQQVLGYGTPGISTYAGVRVRF
ncbi:MAG: TonB-dependent receptor [Alphaproteobacteria bacterium]|nr:TonB-dependent receptor [Alphaproteobacteria bacterium]